MADVLNTFEGGTNGTTITTGNSGSTSGDAFGYVGIITGGAAVYTTTSYRGGLAGSFSAGATTGTALAEYSTAVGAASTGAVYGRLRFRLPVLPSDSTGVRVAIIADSTGSFRAELRVINTGAVSIRNAAGSTLATFTATYSAGIWWDVALAITVFSTTVGVIEAKQYGPTGLVVQTITSAASQNTIGSGGTCKLQVGMIRSWTNFTVLVDDVAWSTTGYPSVPVAPAVAYGPWSGGVTDGGFGAAFVLAGTSSARLVVSTNSGLTSPAYSSAVAPDSDGAVKLAITGLTANTQYYYGVEADGVLLAGGRGEVKTFPTAGSAASFSVAFGSCQFTVPSDSTFAAILAKTGAAGGRALQLLHMGDMHYQDWAGGTTAAQVLAQHMVSLGSASMAPMLAKIPIEYCWDNHDWGGDTSDASAGAGNAVAATFRQVYPTYTLPATDSRGAHRSWVVGRVRFIQLDPRSYRDPQSNTENSSKTMLGAEQKTWLKARLVDPEPLKILVASYPWRDDGNGSGRWGSYSDEFDELSNYIDANARGQVYVIFGDRHYLAADDGTSPESRGIPQAGGAPFQQSTVAVAGTWTQGSYTLGGATLQAFGWLDVTDTGTKITVDYSGISSLDSTTRVSMSTVFNPVAAASLPVVATLTAGAVRGRPAGAALAVTATLTPGASSNRQVIDDFNDNSISADWDTAAGGAQVTETGGQFRVATTLSAGFYSATQIPAYDIAGRYVTVKVAAAGNQSLASYAAYPLGVRFSATNEAYWLVTGNQAACYTNVGGSVTFRNVMTYTPGVHNYLAIGIDAGQLVWQWSSDGVAWSVLHTMATPFSTDTTVSPYVQVGTGSTEASTTALVLDDLTLQPIAAAAVTAGVTLPVTATLTAGAQRATSTGSTLPVTATLTAGAARATTAAAALPVTATLTLGAQATATAATTLAVTATLTAGGNVGSAPITAATAITITATLTAGAARAAPASAVLVTTATLTTTSTVTGRPGVALAVTATLTAAPTGLASSGAVLAVTAALIAAMSGYERVTRRPFAGVTARP